MRMGMEDIEMEMETEGSQRKDPCWKQVQSYIECVNSHTNGLSEGNECKEEVKAYKDCRKKEQKTQQQQKQNAQEGKQPQA